MPKVPAISGDAAIKCFKKPAKPPPTIPRHKELGRGFSRVVVAGAATIKVMIPDEKRLKTDFQWLVKNTAALQQKS